MKKCLIGIAVLGLGAPLAAQSSGEWLAHAPLPGLVVGSRVAQNGSLIVEWVPRGETVQRWTRMVTVQRFAGLGPRFQLWADRFASGIMQSCPGAAVTGPTYSQIQGHEQAEFRVDCPRNPETGQPETFLLLAIAGTADLHVAQVAYRHVPDAEETRWAQRQLASVTLCTHENGSPICRTPPD
jgi:hypothetical protein